MDGKIEGKRVLSFDFGASSGRAMLGSFDGFGGGKIEMEEIHRFSNDPVMICGTLYWDTTRLFFEIKQGIIKAMAKGGFDAIGIDTWGVDFGLLDKSGRLLASPIHYRDLRTRTAPKEFFEKLPQGEVYEKTGIQFMHINSLFQLVAAKKQQPELFGLVDKVLFMPDLFAYFLTGEMRCERTIASTSNMYDPTLREFDKTILEKAGLNEAMFPPFINAGEVYGNLLHELCEELSCKSVPVIAVGTHDTASAALATPTEEKDFIFISCGTWSLFGTESDIPYLTKEAEALCLTNETGVGDKVLLMRNIMGLWLIQQSRQFWLQSGEEVTFNLLEQEALAAEPFRCFIDPDDLRFEVPGNLPKRVQEYCRDTAQYIPQTRGEIMRCIYQSLALKYRSALDSLKTLTGKDYRIINMLGGGIKDTLLCQMTANATATKVIAGPTEATVIGNIATQLVGLFEIADFKQARKVIMNSTVVKEYSPVEVDKWEAAYQKYIEHEKLQQKLKNLSLLESKE